MEERFKKGDYIVILQQTHCSFVNNHCMKQRVNAYHFRPELDSFGSLTNGLNSLHITNPKRWRYAKPHEISEYDRLGKPYDVTTISEQTYQIF